MFRRLYLSYLQLNYPEARVADLYVPVVPVGLIGRRCLSRLLLVCYALLMMKPALPVVRDMIAHTFNREAHLKVVHRVNGKAHVHYELCKAAKEGQQQGGAEVDA